MHELEWQSALLKVAYERKKFCVVRLDDCEAPAILAQKVYIDMYNDGLEAAKVKILKVVKGESTFEPKHTQFKNLTCAVKTASAGGYSVTITAKMLKEPDPGIEFLIQCAPNAASVYIEGAQSLMMQSYRHGIAEDLRIFVVKDTGGTGALYPSKPITYLISRNSALPIKLVGVFTRNSDGNDEPIWPPI